MLKIIKILFFLLIILLIIHLVLLKLDTHIQKIPQTIHQIWIGDKNPPDIYLDTWRNNYIKMYPKWNYILWKETDIDQLFKKEYFDLDINRLKYIYDTESQYCGKADIARLLILYNFGGIYIDADSVWVNNKNLDNVLKKTKHTGMFAAFEPNQSFLANGVIGSNKFNSNVYFLLKKLERMADEYINIREKKDCWEVTGPLLLDKIKNNITTLESIYFYPMDWHGITDKQLHKKIKLPEKSYMFQYGISTNGLTF